MSRTDTAQILVCDDEPDLREMLQEYLQKRGYSVTLAGNADEMRAGRGKGSKPRFLSNNAGGILGGISTGQDVVARFAVKPTSSLVNLSDSVSTFKVIPA